MSDFDLDPNVQVFPELQQNVAPRLMVHTRFVNKEDREVDYRLWYQQFGMQCELSVLYCTTKPINFMHISFSPVFANQECTRNRIIGVEYPLRDLMYSWRRLNAWPDPQQPAYLPLHASVWVRVHILPEYEARAGDSFYKYHIGYAGFPDHQGQNSVVKVWIKKSPAMGTPYQCPATLYFHVGHDAPLDSSSASGLLMYLKYGDPDKVRRRLLAMSREGASGGSGESESDDDDHDDDDHDDDDHDDDDHDDASDKDDIQDCEQGNDESRGSHCKPAAQEEGQSSKTLQTDKQLGQASQNLAAVVNAAEDLHARTTIDSQDPMSHVIGSVTRLNMEEKTNLD